ncbi:unnamed protein product [marine sediment metagenome]|uniref:STAS/SEC14 domain-containing protein n=1 Tax=marine sediment metagenome TaxID=412755 RepID=X0X2P8_9ZZZZ
MGARDPVLTSYEIDSERRVIVVTVRGELRDEDFLEIHERLRTEPRLEPDFGLLIDLQGATGRDVTIGGVQNLIALPLLLSPKARRAIVVQSDLGFGMSRMYELQRRDLTETIGIFRDVDEAQRWLDEGGA